MLRSHKLLLQRAKGGQGNQAISFESGVRFGWFASPLFFTSDPEHQGTLDRVERQTRFAYDNLPGQFKSINLTYESTQGSQGPGENMQNFSGARSAADSTLISSHTPHRSPTLHPRLLPEENLTWFILTWAVGRPGAAMLELSAVFPDSQSSVSTFQLAHSEENTVLVFLLYFIPVGFSSEYWHFC